MVYKVPHLAQPVLSIPILGMDIRQSTRARQSQIAPATPATPGPPGGRVMPVLLGNTSFLQTLRPAFPVRRTPTLPQAVSTETSAHAMPDTKGPTVGRAPRVLWANTKCLFTRSAFDVLDLKPGGLIFKPPP